MKRLCVLLSLYALSALGVYAQTPIPMTNPTPQATPTLQVVLPLPASYRLQGIRFEAQTWNNCGPATLTNALSYYGYQDRQSRAAAWLKPNYEDKNVSPWQMAEFVNTQVPEIPVFALVRTGGTLELLKRLLSNDFPVIIEKGYDPEPERLGWMGHYLLMTGYDDAAQTFYTDDSYIGENTPYSYEYVQNFWQHFNYTYLVVYSASREAELKALLGTDADEFQNKVNSLERARTEASSNPQNAFAWFNMGSNFVSLGMYNEAAIAYDQARSIGLPWRMLWYQFGPLEAYYQVGRYDDVVVLAQANLNDGGGHFVEETFYYGGLARMGKGELERAISNFDAALQFNPNFTPAREAKNLAQQKLAGG